MSSPAKNLLPWLVLLAVVAKIGYLLTTLPELSLSSNLSIDALYHYRWASAIASGDYFANAPYFRAPLYPMILAFLLKIANFNLTAVRAMQLLAGCITLFVVYRIAEKMIGRRGAALALLLTLFYPMTTYLDGELLLDSLFTLFALASLYLFLPDDKGRVRSGWAGVFFSLAALTRPTVLIFVPIIIWHLWHHGQSVGTSAKGIIRFVLVAILLIAPVTIINYYYSHQFILVSYQGGINFYIGNNPSADGITSELPEVGQDWKQADADYVAYEETGNKILYGEQSNFWYRKGFEFALAHPGAYLELTARKVYFLFSGNEISDNRPLDEFVFHNPLLRFFPIRFSYLVGLAIIPFFLARSDRRRILALYGIVLFYGLTTASFFVNSRFRLPLVPVTAILAAGGVVCVVESIRTRRFGYRFFFAAVCAVALILTTAPDTNSTAFSNPSQALFLRGNAALRARDYDLAVARFDSLARTVPHYRNSSLNLGIAYLKKGDPSKAADAFREELRFSPNSAEAANNLGVTFLLQNSYDSARIYCRQALERKPYYPEAAINFLRSLRSADSLFQQSGEPMRLKIRPYLIDQPSYLFEEAVYLADRKKYAEALLDQLRAERLLTGRPAAITFESMAPATADERLRLLRLIYYQLGYLNGLLGKFESSVVYSRQAIALDPQFREAYINLISGYRSLGAQQLADSVVQEYLARWPQP